MLQNDFFYFMLSKIPKTVW